MKTLNTTCMRFIVVAFILCAGSVSGKEMLIGSVSFDFSIKDFIKVKTESLKACLADEYLKGVMANDNLFIVLPPSEYKALLDSYKVLSKNLNVQYLLGDGKNIPTSSIKKGNLKISISIRDVRWNDAASQCLVKVIVYFHWPNGELRGYGVDLKGDLADAKWKAGNPQLVDYSKE